MRRLFKALFPGKPDHGIEKTQTILGTVVASRYVYETLQPQPDRRLGQGHRSRVFIVLLCIGLIDIGFAEELDRYELVLTFGTVLLGLIGVLSPTRDRGLTPPAPGGGRPQPMRRRAPSPMPRTLSWPRQSAARRCC